MADKQVRIMDAIQEKETELKIKVIEAKKTAETKVVAARKKTAKIREEAHLRAEEKVKIFISKGLAHAHAQEKEILMSTKSSVSYLKTLSKKNFPTAIDIVIRAVSGHDFIEAEKTGQKIVIPMIDQQINPETEIREAADGGCEDAS